jgi:hypothetical protein
MNERIFSLFYSLLDSLDKLKLFKFFCFLIYLTISRLQVMNCKSRIASQELQVKNCNNLYNNLAKPFTTVGADPFFAQTSGLDHPNFCRHTPNWLRKINSQKNSRKMFKKFEIFFLNFFFEFFF